MDGVALRDLIASLRERTWLSPVSAEEMNRRDRWLADQLDAILLTLLDGQEPPKEPKGYCFNPECDCHVDPDRRVHTPFPDEGWPPYCCNRCARSGLPPTAPEQAPKEPQKEPSLNDFSGPLNTRERLLHRRCQRAESDVERLIKRERVAQDALYEITQRWTKAVEIREQQRQENAALTQRLTAVEQERDKKQNDWAEMVRLATRYEKQLEAHAAALIALREKLAQMKTDPVPPTIATDDEFRFIYCQGYRHAVADLTALIERKP